MTSALANAPDLDRTAVVDVTEFIDQQPVVAFQLPVLLFCAAVLFVDGFDTQAIGYAAAAISHLGLHNL